jgi:hypothetical protein
MDFQLIKKLRLKELVIKKKEKTMIFTYPKPCVCCGKKAPKKTETFITFGTPAIDEYKGNLKVIAKLYDGERLTLWDGESYEHRNGHFCSLKCCERYANHIVAKEIKRNIDSFNKKLR